MAASESSLISSSFPHIPSPAHPTESRVCGDKDCARSFWSLDDGRGRVDNPAWLFSHTPGTGHWLAGDHARSVKSDSPHPDASGNGGDSWRLFLSIGHIWCVFSPAHGGGESCVPPEEEGQQRIDPRKNSGHREYNRQSPKKEDNPVRWKWRVRPPAAMPEHQSPPYRLPTFLPLPRYCGGAERTEPDALSSRAREDEQLSNSRSRSARSEDSTIL